MVVYAEGGVISGWTEISELIPRASMRFTWLHLLSLQKVSKSQNQQHQQVRKGRDACSTVLNCIETAKSSKQIHTVSKKKKRHLLAGLFIYSHIKVLESPWLLVRRIGSDMAQAAIPRLQCT